MNKYYTPEIEEFHFGFEFESNYVLFGKDWTKVVLSEEHDWFYSSYVNDAVPTEFRVKYLDKEDIESLGWKFDKISNEGQWKFFKDNICLYYRPKTHELGIFTIDPSKSDYMMKHIMDNKQIHILIIKNKSELKKLMKQLNIL